MGYINPLFENNKIVKNETQTKIDKPEPIIPRSIRKDKTHSIKFPVTPLMQMKLKSQFKQAKRLGMSGKRGELTQTKFNTYLLHFGLQHPHIIWWKDKYSDTKTYMHTNILETIYEAEIGGPHGLAIQKNLSERKVVYHIINSVLKWLEGEGSIEKIL
ncbi:MULTISPECIES: hypothetical protein [Bacillota]|uniref:hypothetical protein n=1 Tax=Bacillota TaxID=1239 RepID=UPI0039EFE001